MLHDCAAEVTYHSLVGVLVPTQNASTEVSALSKLRAVGVVKGDGVWAALDKGVLLVVAVKLGLLTQRINAINLAIYPQWVRRQRRTHS
eukprot:8928427-Pyramimonas_sp.AAC.1